MTNLIIEITILFTIMTSKLIHYCNKFNDTIIYMYDVNFLNKVSLHMPSTLHGCVHHTVCKYLFVLYVSNETFDQINISEKLDTKLILEVSTYFGQEKHELLPPYLIPEAINEMPAEDHRLSLVKHVANSYININLRLYGGPQVSCQHFSFEVDKTFFMQENLIFGTQTIIFWP